jgi:biopolymer transport protein ExbB
VKSRIIIPITIVSVIVSYFIWQNSPEYIHRGGPLLVVGLTLLFLALTFAVERFLVLGRAGGRGRVEVFVAAVKSSLGKGDVATGIAACRNQGGSIANVIGAGLETYQRLGGQAGNGLERTQKALQDATALESPNLERNLTALSTIASIATLVGLLGTTIGMIRSFQAMSHAGAPDATQLALGISEALVNTALGLMTAILATVLYNYFTTKVDMFNDSVEETSYEVLAILETGKES